MKHRPPNPELAALLNRIPEKNNDYPPKKGDRDQGERRLRVLALALAITAALLVFAIVASLNPAPPELIKFDY